MKRWRVIDTGYLDCYTNMAIDEALLKRYDPARELPVLRIYGWKPRAFSIGYSQNPEVELDLDKCRTARIDFARRITGGGAIFHKNELTYSIVCSKEDLELSTFSKEAYRVLCSFIVKTYQNLGLFAEYSLQETLRQGRNWFCFTEREKYDIIVNGKKIGGNAQRRKKDRIFQHGSIPIRSDLKQALSLLRNCPKVDKSKITSLSEVLGQDISYSRLKSLLIESFKQTFKVDITENGLSPEERTLTRLLLNEKYAKEEWNLYRDVSDSET